MTIKCRKGVRSSILHFSTTFTNDEKLKLQDCSYDMKCHLKAINCMSSKPIGQL